jgi:hypothetical protein
MKQKIATHLILLVFISSKLCAQQNAKLCNKNEVQVFAFQLQNKKWVSVCKEEKEQYLVYRIVTDNKIEFQYPLVLDSSSWKKFSFSSYTREFGKKDVAMHFAYLDFDYKGNKYEVYETFDAEAKQEHCGVKVAKAKNTTDMEGILNTREGNLLTLGTNDRFKQ